MFNIDIKMNREDIDQNIEHIEHRARNAPRPNMEIASPAMTSYLNILNMILNISNILSRG